jgi:Predicted permease
MIFILDSKSIKNLLIINLSFLAIILFSKMFYVHRFIKILSKSFLIPLLISLFLYYISRPLNDIFIKKGLKPGLSALLTLTISTFIISGVLSFFSNYIMQQFSVITKQFTNIMANDGSMNGVISKIDKYININLLYNSLNKRLTNIAQSYMQNIESDFLSFINYIMDTFSKVFLILVLLYYLFKDGPKFRIKIVSFLPYKYKKTLSKILSESNEALSSYVTGQAKVALALSVMIFIGYKAIGMPNALLLASITFVLAFIPFVGFIISMIFPTAIALSMGFSMVVKLAVTFAIVQILKGRVVVPAIMASSMKIHPLTDIFLVMGAIALGGSICAFCIVPIYAIIKVILINLHQYRLKKLE